MTKLKKGVVSGDAEGEEGKAEGVVVGDGKTDGDDSELIKFVAGKFAESPAKFERMEGSGRTREGIEGEGPKGLDEGVKELGDGPTPAPAPLPFAGSDLDIHDLLLSGFTVVVVCLSLMCVFNAPSDP